MNKWNAETVEWYANNYGEYDTNKWGVEALTLSPKLTVVDIGCGTGCALRHVVKKVTNGKLIGIDPIPRMVQIAKERTDDSRISYKVGPAEQVPIDSGIADIVLAFDSFDHWQNQTQGLKEVKRILKPEGLFVVIKDGGVPKGDKYRQTFLDKLQKTGLALTNERSIEKDDISFVMWECYLTV